MTPFPPSDALSFLMADDAWISQITFNATSMVLVFANDCRIEVGLGLTYVSETGEKFVYDAEWFQVSSVHFLSLFEKALVSVATDNLVMTLNFANGAALIISSDLEPYEAGAVLGPKGSRLGFYF